MDKEDIHRRFAKSFPHMAVSGDLHGFFAGEIAGYGTERRCRTDHKVRSWFAEDRRIAEKLLRGLIYTPYRASVIPRCPETNDPGNLLAQDLWMIEAFKTAGMDSKSVPPVPLMKMFR